MYKKRVLALTVIALALVTYAGLPLWAQYPLGTAVTYQGFLKQNGRPVNHPMDLRFTLFADPNATQQTGQPIEVIDMDVVNGHFTLELDFGAGVFNGEHRWLQQRSDAAIPPILMWLSCRS